MPKKKKKKKKTVKAILEGDLEKVFFEHLRELFTNEDLIHITPEPVSGGSPQSLLDKALHHKDNYKVCFVLLDEDVQLPQEARASLARAWGIRGSEREHLLQAPLNSLQEQFNPGNQKKPTLIVSQPICFDGLLLKLLEKNIPHREIIYSRRKQQVTDTKNARKESFSDRGAIQFFAKKLPKNTLMKIRKKVTELDLLITLIT